MKNSKKKGEEKGEEKVLYHGTNSLLREQILQKGVGIDSWYTETLHQAIRIAERRSVQRGGHVLVFKLKTQEKDLIRQWSHKEPVWRATKNLMPIGELDINFTDYE